MILKRFSIFTFVVSLALSAAAQTAGVVALTAAVGAAKNKNAPAKKGAKKRAVSDFLFLMNAPRYVCIPFARRAGQGSVHRKYTAYKTPIAFNSRSEG